MMNRIDEQDGYDSSASASASASWSLLDRPGSVMSSSDQTVSTTTKEEEEYNGNNHNNEQPEGEIENDDIRTTTDNNKTTPTKSNKNNTLLSIVTDTLQDTPPTIKSINTISNIPGIPTRTQSISSDHSFDYDDDDDDPILSLLKKESNHTQKGDTSVDTIRQQERYSNKDDDITTKTNTKKSTNRFMEDLEKRLETSEETMEAGRIPNSASYDEYEQQQQQQQRPEPIPYFTRGPFGGAVLNMAARNFNRILKRPDSQSSPQASTPPPPPLTRERPRKLVPTKRPEEDFHVASSTAILGQDDLAELEQLKSKSMSGVSPITILIGSIQEHRHFLFIAFTMLLAVFVYFWTQKRLEDDVTR